MGHQSNVNTDRGLVNGNKPYLWSWRSRFLIMLDAIHWLLLNKQEPNEFSFILVLWKDVKNG